MEWNGRPLRVNVADGKRNSAFGGRYSQGGFQQQQGGQFNNFARRSSGGDQYGQQKDVIYEGNMKPINVNEELREPTAEVSFC